jgi:hypothetical protein
MFRYQPDWAKPKLICLSEEGVKLTDSIFDRCAHNSTPIRTYGDLRLETDEVDCQFSAPWINPDI